MIDHDHIHQRYLRKINLLLWFRQVHTC